MAAILSRPQCVNMRRPVIKNHCLTIKDNQVIVFQEGGFQLRAAFKNQGKGGMKILNNIIRYEVALSD